MANLTSKELSALEDQINCEQTLVKKYQAMSSLCTDPVIQQELSGYAQKHRQHFDTLVSFLQ